MSMMSGIKLQNIPQQMAELSDQDPENVPGESAHYKRLFSLCGGGGAGGPVAIKRSSTCVKGHGVFLDVESN